MKFWQGILTLEILKGFYHFYFLNKDCKVSMKDIDLRFSASVLNIHFEESLSQNLYLCFSFDFIAKIR